MPTPVTPQTIAKAVKDAKATKKRIKLTDHDQAGLRLELTPSGNKTWYLGCRDRSGRMRSFRLGTYPDMGIGEARAEARRLHTAVKGGADPVADAKRDRAAGKDAKAGVGTLRAILDTYTAADPPKSWAASRKTVEKVFGAFLPRPVTEIEARDLQATADTYPARGSAGHAVRALKAALNWAAKHHVLADKRLADIHAKPPKRRTRTLSHAELAAVLPVLTTNPTPHRMAMRFMLLTLARLDEVCGATWQEIDIAQGVWTIPGGGRTKNEQEHILDLPTQALRMLQELKISSKYTKANDLIFCTGNGTGLGNWDKENKKIHKKSNTSGWHRHDLRRTGATLAARLGTAPHYIEAALNHKNLLSHVATIYNAERYRPDVKIALQALADELDRIERGIILTHPEPT